MPGVSSIVKQVCGMQTRKRKQLRIKTLRQVYSLYLSGKEEFLTNQKIQGKCLKGLQVAATSFSFYMGAGDPNTGLHGYVANT